MKQNFLLIGVIDQYSTITVSAKCKWSHLKDMIYIMLTLRRPLWLLFTAVTNSVSAQEALLELGGGANGCFTATVQMT